MKYIQSKKSLALSLTSLAALIALSAVSHRAVAGGKAWVCQVAGNPIILKFNDAQLSDATWVYGEDSGFLGQTKVEIEGDAISVRARQASGKLALDLFVKPSSNNTLVGYSSFDVSPATEPVINRDLQRPGLVENQSAINAKTVCN